MASSSSLRSSSSSSSSLAPVCGVELDISPVTQANGGYTSVLTVLSTVCLPTELFVFQRKPSTPVGAYDEFSHVASPSDIEEYPAGQAASHTPFYRLDAVTLVFRELELLRQSLRDLKQDISALVETTNQLNNLTSYQLVIDEDGVIGANP